MRTRKPDLQRRLEEQGWEFCTNVDPSTIVIDEGPRRCLQIIALPCPRSDSQLRREYKKGGFKKVLVTDAFDLYGKPSPEDKAIYVKK